MERSDVKIGQVFYPKHKVAPNVDINDVTEAWEFYEEAKVNVKGEISGIKIKRFHSWKKGDWMIWGRGITYIDQLMTKDQFEEAVRQATLNANSGDKSAS